MKKRVIILIVFVIFGMFGGTSQTLRLACNPEAKKKVLRDRSYSCHEKPSKFLAISYVYSGVRKDLIHITFPYHCGWSGGEVGMLNDLFFMVTIPFVVVDLGVSFVLDTVILPFTIYKQFEEGYIIDPPYFAIGKMYRSDDEKAIQYYEKGLEVLPKYFGENNFVEAERYLRDFDEEVLFNLARFHAEKSDYKAALYYYDKLIDLKNEQIWSNKKRIEIHQRVVFDLARLHAKKKDYETAIYYYNKSIELEYKQAHQSTRRIEIYRRELNIAKSKKNVHLQYTLPPPLPCVPRHVKNASGYGSDFTLPGQGPGPNQLEFCD